MDMEQLKKNLEEALEQIDLLMMKGMALETDTKMQKLTLGS